MKDIIWVLKSKGEESSFGGNDGYDDVIGSSYVYDDTVKNHDRLDEGDMVIIAGKKYIEGFARIAKIQVREGVAKQRFRCPECNTQEHYFRKNITPKYKCRNKHTFDSPIVEDILVKQFVASYKSQFLQAPSNTHVSILNDYYIKRNLYYSIQPARITFFSSEFPDAISYFKLNLDEVTRALLPFDYGDEYDPSDEDTRSSSLVKRITREGQLRFREQLFENYERRCVITGCSVQEAIEASHISPYRGKKDNHKENGLLLRKDLHALFDADLLGINPDTLHIKLHDSLKSSHYSELENIKVNVLGKGRPSKKALEIRWKLFQERCIQTIKN